MTARAQTLYDMSLADLEALLKSLGQPAFRAKQIYRQLYVNLADDVAAMTDLPAALRERLAEAAPVTDLKLERVQVGDKGMTRKALFALPDKGSIESVLMLYSDRATVCVSTQSGCAMGCAFCATGQLGYCKHLTTDQMIAQVLWAAREVKTVSPDASLSNVVYMGMGEPFNNYERWWASVDRLHDPKGFNMGARSFTVSTVGIVPGIERLAGEELPINLALSLHAGDDELRDKLVPINKRYPIAELMRAVRFYTETTHRRVSFEYVLLHGVNDSVDQALKLAEWTNGKHDKRGPLLCHVNLIPWNPVSGVKLNQSERRRVLEFQRTLQDRHVPCTVRVQRGVDIAAACGQLAGGAQ